MQTGRPFFRELTLQLSFRDSSEQRTVSSLPIWPNLKPYNGRMRSYLTPWFLISGAILLSACSASDRQAPAPVSGESSPSQEAEPDVAAETPTESTSDEVLPESESQEKLGSVASAPPIVEPVTIDLNAIPTVDVRKHSVPLGDVYFDTFRAVNRAVPLDRTSTDLIRSLLDAIPPIYNPIFETAASAKRWLGDHDLVLGYAGDTEAYAYPINILNLHEMVRHDVDGIPILVTYCPLCRSGIVYDSRIQGERLLFGNTSALYESDMVMVDHATGSYWMQVSGEAIVGPLTGARLKALPSQITTWGQWLQQYPHTFSLSPDTGYDRDYSRNPFTGIGEQLTATGRFPFPVSDRGRDPRLDPGEVVFGVQIDATERAYAIARIGDGVVNDLVAGKAVVVFTSVQGPTAAAYSATVDDRTLTFKFADGVIRDGETGSTWDFTGRATAGVLKGAQLEPLPSRTTFWFAMIAAFPELELYSAAN